MRSRNRLMVHLSQRRYINSDTTLIEVSLLPGVERNISVF